MGLFDTPEEKREKQEIKKMQEKIASQGLANVIKPEDYQKVILEQNQTMINLLTVIGISQSGIAGDAFVLEHQKGYYKQLKKIIE